MKYFEKIAQGIDTSPFLAEIAANSELWDFDASRQQKIVTQRETQAITLRSHADQASLDSRVRRAKPLGYKGRPSPVSARLPFASNFVDQLAKGMNGTLGRAVLANIRPHGTVYRHTDDGLYWLLRDRYHLVLKSVAGSRFIAGGEECHMHAGELWWFDPTVPHEAFNDSDDDRIHIIADVMSPHSMRTFRKRLARSPLKRGRAFANAAFKGAAWTVRERFHSAGA
jgi:hypothetical protein